MTYSFNFDIKHVTPQLEYTYDWYMHYAAGFKSQIAELSEQMDSTCSNTWQDDDLIGTRDIVTSKCITW